MPAKIVQQAAAAVFQKTEEGGKTSLVLPRHSIEVKQQRIMAICQKLLTYCEDDESRFTFLLSAVLTAKDSYAALEKVGQRAEEGTLVVDPSERKTPILSQRGPKGYNRAERRQLAKRMSKKRRNV